MLSYDDNLRALARRAYAHHQIREQGDGRWLLMAPAGRGWSGNHWVSIIVDQGRIILHGDGELCYFGGYSGEGGPEGVVRWVARSRGDLRYLANKAAHGAASLSYETDVREAAGDILSGLEDVLDERTTDILGEIEADWILVREYRDDDESSDVPNAYDEGDEAADAAACATLWWIIALAAALRDDGWGPKWQRRFDGLEDATERLEEGDVSGARRELYEAGWDSESVYKVGEVVAPRIYYAQAACARLVELWDRAEKVQSA